ncbi:MAG: hypothetical protein M1833_007047 [Piccolia ochrophora]|nr:MAG: hypothetical protein M1833_007047 [Piccolia ochrophora]
MTTAQSSQQPLTSSTNTFPTPASSVAGNGPPSVRPTEVEDEEGDVQMRAHDGNDGMVAHSATEEQQEDAMNVDSDEHRRTDHEREEGRSIVTEGADPAEPSHTLRDDPKTALSEHGESVEHGSGEEKAEESGIRADLGPLYLLCKDPHPMSRPHPTQNLLSLYGLDALAASVARTDPGTGEKRKIRKTYKGKIQGFKLPGRDKEVKHPEGQPGGLVEMMQWPDEEWHNQKVAGKEVAKGLPESVMAKLNRALYMEPGDMPGFDASILGLDMPAPAPVDSKRASQTAASQPLQAPQTNGNTPRGNTTADSPPADPARPKRTGKKRRYDERSFEGYGEGFVDDEGDVQGGYTDSDREDGGRRGSSGKKKRKKNSMNGLTSPLLDTSGGSYGIGMYGVQSGLGAYGSR